MATIFIGKRTNVAPGQETFSSTYRGTEAYLRMLRAEIRPETAQQVDDAVVDAIGRYIGPPEAKNA